MLIDLSAQYVTTTEYAAFFRYADERPVVRLIRSGRIPGAVQRPDGRYLIPAHYIKRNLPTKESNHGHD